MLSLRVAVVALVFGLSHPSSASEFYQNQLLPFTTDGCTGSPNGTFNNTKLWLHCCVEHDLSYWKGGTSEEKLAVDKEFGACVTTESDPVMGRLMYLGVRAGGGANYPTSWNWGYGWVASRGYAPLSAYELAQVEEQKKLIPVDLKSLAITRTIYLPEKLSVTGDYCLDEVAQKIEMKLGHGFNISEVKLTSKRTPKLVWKTVYSLTTDECSKPIRGVFYLRVKNGCRLPRKKFTALATFYPVKIKSLDSCGQL